MNECRDKVTGGYATLDISHVVDGVQYLDGGKEGDHIGVPLLPNPVNKRTLNRAHVSDLVNILTQHPDTLNPMHHIVIMASEDSLDLDSLEKTLEPSNNTELTGVKWNVNKAEVFLIGGLHRLHAAKDAREKLYNDTVKAFNIGLKGKGDPATATKVHNVASNTRKQLTKWRAVVLIRGERVSHKGGSHG